MNRRRPAMTGNGHQSINQSINQSIQKRILQALGLMDGAEQIK